MGLINRVLDVMDSDHAGEFAERFVLYFKSDEGWDYWEAKKRHIEQFRTSPDFDLTKTDFVPFDHRTTESEEENEPDGVVVDLVQMGSVQITQEKTSSDKWDYLDHLLYDIDKSNAITIVSPFVLPKFWIMNQVEEHVLEDFVEPVLDKIQIFIGPKLNEWFDAPDMVLHPDSLASPQEKKKAKATRNKLIKEMQQEIDRLIKRRNTRKVLKDPAEYRRLSRKIKRREDELELFMIIAERQKRRVRDKKIKFNWKKAYDVFVRQPLRRKLSFKSGHDPDFAKKIKKMKEGKL